LRAAKKKLKEVTFNGARNEFFATVDTLEISKQLDPSLMDMNQKSYEPENIVHNLKERREVAELMRLPFQDLSEEDELAQRIILINALIELGRVEKIPSERIISKTNGEYAAKNEQESSPQSLSQSKEDFSPSQNLATVPSL
jgi:Protein of unknown function (DUF3435).